MILNIITKVAFFNIVGFRCLNLLNTGPALTIQMQLPAIYFNRNRPVVCLVPWPLGTNEMAVFNFINYNTADKKNI